MKITYIREAFYFYSRALEPTTTNKQHQHHQQKCRVHEKANSGFVTNCSALVCHLVSNSWPNCLGRTAYCHCTLLRGVRRLPSKNSKEKSKNSISIMILFFLFALDSIWRSPPCTLHTVSARAHNEKDNQKTTKQHSLVCSNELFIFIFNIKVHFVFGISQKRHVPSSAVVVEE